MTVRSGTSGASRRLSALRSRIRAGLPRGLVSRAWNCITKEDEDFLDTSSSRKMDYLKLKFLINAIILMPKPKPM